MARQRRRTGRALHLSSVFKNKFGVYPQRFVQALALG
jgi:hypothetical protein